MGDSIEASVTRLLAMIKEIQAAGIPPARTILGGYSQGGGISLQFALRHPELLGAAFSLSSYACYDSAVYELLQNDTMRSSASKLPFFMAHGTADSLVPLAWGNATQQRLLGLGMQVNSLILPGVEHELTSEELTALVDFLLPILTSADEAMTMVPDSEEVISTTSTAGPVS